MPRLSRDEREAFLTEKRVVMRIAVVRDDGSPLVTPIWFLYRDGAIWFTPREHSEWFGCLRRDPRAALSIDEQPLPYRKILVEGNAELVHDVGEDDEWRELYRDMARKYVPANDADAYVDNTIDERRGLFRMNLSDCRVRSWRLPVGDEPGEGIWHSRYYQDESTSFETRTPPAGG